ncbi:MAG: sortase [Candidatus Peribacteraceae bacterium]
MISERFTRHRAIVDEDGNIILESDADSAKQPAATEEMTTWSWTEAPPTPEEIFDVLDEIPSSYDDDLCLAETGVSEQLSGVRRHIAEDVLSEGIRQYSASIHGAKPLLVGIKTETDSLLKRLGSFLSQPVWIPVRGARAKQTNRGLLFIGDTVRFGGVFAMIFLALFVALNYQSFWEITRSRIAPFLSPTAGLNADIASALEEKLKLLPGLPMAGGSEGDLLAALPQVGPPDNRIVIPALNLNVPLVTPKYEALLKGDWTQVEKDIQDALVSGVVHYPGTARPGQAGNFFVTGHSSYYPWAPGKYKNIFARLSDLKIGDEYWVYYGGDKHRYVIRSKKEVRPSDITVLDQPPDQRLSTLMTCTPVGTALRRLILVAEEVDPVNGTTLAVGERASQQAPEFNMEALPM